jgi:amino acid transporter
MGISASIVVIVPLVHASAGNGTWLAFAMAMVAYVLVAVQVNVFATRIATPGSIHAFVHAALGPVAGSVAGWMLLFGYLAFMPAYIAGVPYYLSAFAQGLLGPSMDVLASTPGELAVSGGVAAMLGWFVSFRSIGFSTRVILYIEIATLGLIFTIVACHFYHGGVRTDSLQLGLEGVSVRPFGAGLALAMACFLGFEACSVLGVEAKLPLKMIPRGNMITVIVTGGAIVVAAYALVQAFHGQGLELAEAEYPLKMLASAVGLDFIAPFILGGVALSGFGCILGSLNTGGRLLYSLSRQNASDHPLARIHALHRSPHIANGLIAVIGFGATLALVAAGFDVMAIINYSVTFGAFGFFGAYILCSVGAAIYLCRQTRGFVQKSAHVFLTALAISSMMVPLVASVISVP